ncbi:ABC transporter ATP-binding protein [Mariprofundus erugo]|uniref:ABC transporter ATP-binding protein n=1 Tax=Mariprofundus erugo TaxID=2528639 RepID=UPI0010FF1D9C|nr:ABC transporter ATP-binding protein [Mariprofundus erugo]TLS77559.1 ABC transporter ATP-binding protein [Mariprofundus erugo]
MSARMQLTDVSIRRGDRVLLSQLSCELHAGEITVVLGPNGAGKSSLLLAMARLIEASGSITLAGRPLANFSRHELTGQISWQGELPPTEFGLTVQQRLELAGTDAKEEIESVATGMDINHLLSRPLGQLSSGERQRTELAALMLRDTPLWLLDEPTAHLDLKHQIQCIEMLKSQRDKGRTIITVLHDLQQAMAIADHLILIDGRGGAEHGEAAGLFDPARMTALFSASLRQQGALLVPDYGEKT